MRMSNKIITTKKTKDSSDSDMTSEIEFPNLADYSDYYRYQCLILTTTIQTYTPYCAAAL